MYRIYLIIMSIMKENEISEYLQITYKIAVLVIFFLQNPLRLRISHWLRIISFMHYLATLECSCKIDTKYFIRKYQFMSHVSIWFLFST